MAINNITGVLTRTAAVAASLALALGLATTANAETVAPPAPEATTSPTPEATPSSEPTPAPAPAAPQETPTPAISLPALPTPNLGTAATELGTPGWHAVGGDWYYYDADRRLVRGWEYIGGNWYYLSPQTGAMQTGWIMSAGGWFYFLPSGPMLTGWLNNGGQWYYLAPSGVMKTGWVQTGGVWYYLSREGVLQTGWITFENNWYYLDPAGPMQTGWALISGLQYFFGDDGVMRTGWVHSDGQWHYFGSNGALVDGELHAVARPERVELSWAPPPSVEAPPIMLAPGEFVVLDESEFGFGLGGSDAVRLFASDGATLIDSFAWTSHASTTYARCPDGAGPFTTSLEPTKGAANACSAGTAAHGLQLNELAVDEPGGGWVELYNSSTEPVSLDGIMLKDQADATYSFPTSEAVAPGSFLLIPQAELALQLGASGSVQLLATDGQLELDSFAWDSPASATFARCVDGAGAFGASDSATPGSANLCATASALSGLRLNEIESSGGVPGDWIEIVNVSDTAVALSGLVVKDSNDANAYVIPRGPATEGQFELQHRQGPTGAWQSQTVTGTTASVANLTANLDYEFRVRLVTGGVAGTWSDAVTARPLPATAPEAVRFDRVTLDASLTRLSVAFAVPETGGRALTGLEWSFRDADAVDWPAATALATSARAFDTAALTPGRAYVVRVRALSSVGAGPWRESTTMTVPLRSEIPMMSINTADAAPIVNKEDYVAGEFSLTGAQSSNVIAQGTLGIRGRGNSTWGQPKKPYRIKLDQAASFFGLPADRDWVLLANYLDRSFVRNAAALELGQSTDLAWTPSGQSVEVVLNGRYLGLYQLVEHVKIGPERIAIDSLSASDLQSPAITGGYTIERDGHLNLEFDDGFVTPAGQPFTIDDPSPLPIEQLSYISQYVSDAENAIVRAGSGDGLYTQFIDVDSFIDWYLIEELTRNTDAWFSSAKMYKPRSGKLTMGPLWDFDLAFGTPRGNLDTATGWHVRQTDWFVHLFKDPAFVSQVKQRWAELKPHFVAMVQRIDQLAAPLTAAANNDKLVWRYSQTFAVEASAVSRWYNERMLWLATQFEGTPTGWQPDGGTWRYINPDGSVYQGWLLDNGQWYHLGEAGLMATGWQYIIGSWYFFGGNGAMLTQWVSWGGQWFYLGPGGDMKVGWVLDRSTWYYTRGDGSMHTGWLQLGTTWYYLRPGSGQLATGSLVIEGRVHRFSASGAWLG